MASAEREVAARVRVRYADTDQMGVAYYANYLVWFEVGRSEYMRTVGYPYRKLEGETGQMPVVEATCQYRKPAQYDDLLDVCTCIRELGPASLRFAYRVVRRPDGEILATGTTRHAMVGRDGRLRRIPDEVKRCLMG